MDRSQELGVLYEGPKVESKTDKIVIRRECEQTLGRVRVRTE